VVVDGQASSFLEQLQDAFGRRDGVGGAAHENKGVIGVLEDGARLIGEDGMSNIRGKVMVLEQTAKNIGNNDEKIR